MSAEDKSGKIRLVITEPHPGASDSLRAALAETSAGTRDTVQILGVARDGLEAAQLAVQLAPDVILLHEQLPGMSGYEASGMIALAAPDVATVVLVSRERINEDILQRALRVGARAVAPEDASADVLSQLLSDLVRLAEGRAEPEYELITDPDRMPVMVAITGAKGGIGKTTIAVNLAVSFAQRYPGQVTLVDFYGQYGNIPLMLDLTLQSDIGELATFAGQLDASVIETHLATHAASGLRVLAGTSRGGGLRDILTVEQEIGFLADMIGIMRRNYRFLFFDVPPLLGDASSYIFSRAQYIILVTGLLDISTVRDTATLYRQLLDMHLSPDRVKIVVNRVARQWALSVDDLQQSVGADVALELPDDQATALAAINEGVPLLLSRVGTPLAKGLEDLGKLIEDAMVKERQ